MKPRHVRNRKGDVRVFVTGATGFIGSAVVAELIGSGHQVIGLARSDASATALQAARASVHRGALDDLDSLERGASMADGVIHAAFITPRNRGTMTYAQVAAIDLRAVETLSQTLAGSGRPLVVTSGTAALTGKPSFESDAPDPKSAAAARIPSETAGLVAAANGVRGSIVRLPQVHGDEDVGFLPMLVRVAREKSVSAYVGDGLNRWPAVHRLDAARLYRLALEMGVAGTAYHAVAEEGVPLRSIAEVVGRRLTVPVVSLSADAATAHFGSLAQFVAVDNPASSALTRERLGWNPTHEGLLADLDHPRYFT